MFLGSCDMFLVQEAANVIEFFKNVIWVFLDEKAQKMKLYLIIVWHEPRGERVFLDENSHLLTY